MSDAPRTSLHDVARAAGVSLATVDRVLHGRGGVRAHTIEHVQAVVRRLGAVADHGEAATPEAPSALHAQRRPQDFRIGPEARSPQPGSR